MSKMNSIYIEIEGNVEEQAEELIFTLLAKYKENTNSTVVKVFNNDKKFTDTLRDIYAGLGEIKTFEIL